jgi:5-methylcytosine-specific restriction enzyme A
MSSRYPINVSVAAGFDAAFEVGRLYKRRTELHGRFGGQEQGGISTPTAYPIIFLFTGASGELYGYKDHFHTGGLYWYTGEGQRGDMAMARGNRAIRDHNKSGKVMHLFEEAERSWVRYMGEATYVAHHVEERPDVDGSLRSAIVFELDLAYPGVTSAGVMEVRERISGREMWQRPMAELRELATKRPPAEADPVERRQIARIRSEAVRVYVLRRAGGVCESCDQPAPFTTPAGQPYLEPHHTQRIADGGPDHPRWVAAICPNCHRQVHYGANREAMNERLKTRLGQLERDG